MSNLTRQERAAIEAVSRRFSGTWKEMGDPARAYVTIAGQRLVEPEARPRATAVIATPLVHGRDLEGDPFEKILMVFRGGRVEELE